MKFVRYIVILLVVMGSLFLFACGNGEVNEPSVRGIESIEKTSTEGLVDTYTITFTNGQTTTFTVTNGKDGVTGAQGIQGIQGIPGKDGHTPVITIENGYWYIDGVNTNVLAEGLKGEPGNGISSIKLTNTEGLVDTYTITFTNGKTTAFTVTNGKDGATGAQGIQGIQGEPGKDGHTPVITIENGNWYIDGVDTGKSAIGIKGETGNGISSIKLTNTNGLVDTYTITFTNGQTTTFTVTNGKDGATGSQGIQGIQGEPGKDGHTPVITIENGNWHIDGVDTGKSAIGLKGDAGNGISSIKLTNTEGLVDTYTITFTNGQTTIFTVTNGKDGATGSQGIQGIQGIPGKDGHTPVITIENGYWYIDGVNTLQPAQGVQGETGNGISSIKLTNTEGLIDTYTIYFTDGTITTFTVTNGKDGVDGIQGIQGEPGEDGHSPVITIQGGYWYIDGDNTNVLAEGLKGETGNGVSDVKLTNTEGLIDTYTITYTDGTTSTFTVTNGKDGVDGAQGIQGIQGVPGEDGHTPLITIQDRYWYIDGVNTNVLAEGLKGETGNGISSIEKTSTDGLVDTYTITYTDGTTSTFTITNGKDGVDGMTPYIGTNGNWWIGYNDTGVKAVIQEDYFLIPNPVEEDYYEGKTIVCIGDSITEGVGTSVGVDDYVTLLGEKFGANMIRKGVNGSVLCTGGHRKCNIDMLTPENIKGADIVTILMGINDWDNARENYYSLGTMGSNDSSTIYGAVDMWCRRIKELQELEEFKDTKFYFMTPVITSWNNSVSQKSWDQNKKNICGYTLRELCEAIIKTCEKYEIPVLDLNYYSGIYYFSSDKNNVDKTGGDGIHPTPLGHSYMADTIASFLLDNPTYVKSKEAIKYLLENNDAIKSYIYPGKKELINIPDEEKEHIHIFTEWEYIKEPTCTKKGLILRFCEECNYTETKYVDALGHSIITLDSVEPTCTSPGLTEGSYCENCNCVFVEQDIIDSLTHNFVQGTCVYCDKSILGSSWIVPDFIIGDYSMVVIPDTQNMVSYHSDLYYDMMQWIVDNENTYNIKAAMHMGDLVNNNNANEWEINKVGMNILNQSSIAWMPMRGNHDDSNWFNQYYDYETYGTNREWFGGSYQEGKLDHFYWCVSVGKREYLILSLGWAPSWDVLDWADKVIEENSDKNIIINCHAYMNSDNTLLSSGDSHCPSSYISGYPNGDDIWNKFKSYKNVVLAMGGHISSPDINKFVDVNGDFQDVYSLLVDNQNEDTANGLGMLLLLTFNEDNNVVSLNWYSTKYDALYGQENQYAINVPHISDDFVSEKVDISDLFSNWTTGGPVLYSTGIGYQEVGYNSGSNINLKYSDFIKIDDYQMLELTICGRTGYSATGGFAFYEEANTDSFISYGSASRNGNGMSSDDTIIRTVHVPENAKYIRVTYWADSSKYGYPFSCIGYKNVERCNHDFTALSIEPTCNKEGYNYYHCNKCSFDYIYEYIEPLEHTLVEIEVEPTCTEAGYINLVCSTCGHEEIKNEVIDITDIFSFTDGKMIIAKNGNIISDSNWMASDYTDISNYQKIIIKTADTKTIGTTVGLAFYDKNKTYLSGVVHTTESGYYNIIIRELEIPENAVYIRTTWYSKNHANYVEEFGEFYCYGYVPSYIEPLDHSYEGIVTAPTTESEGYTTYTCSQCGDSYISDYVDKLETPDFSQLTFTAFGDSITCGIDPVIGGKVEKPYPTLVSETLSLKSYENKAVSGATIASNTLNRACLANLITSYKGEADIISVLGGVNDYYCNLPLGDIDDNDISTIYGSLHISMSYLVENYNESFIFYMTPYKCIYSNRLYSDNNSQGYNLEDIANAIKEVAAIYNIPVLDLFNNGGFENVMNNSDCDGLHPNQKFFTDVTAPQIAQFIKDNYKKHCDYEEIIDVKTIQYDDHIDISNNDVKIIDADKDNTGNSVVTISGNYLIATNIGTALVRIDEQIFKIVVEKAKLNLVMIMGQSNAGNHFENATSDIVCPIGTAYWFGNNQGVNAKEPVSYTMPSMGFHTPLLAELYAQSVENENPVKNVMIWHEGITSKNGQSIIKWAKSATDTSGTDDSVTMLKNCLSYYQVHSDKYEIVSSGVYWLQGESDLTMDPLLYTERFMAMWNRLKSAGMEYLAFFRVRRAVSTASPISDDLYYSASLSAQIKMINDNPDFYMATTITENWIGTSSETHTIDISKYITLMDAYSNQTTYNDEYGNYATIEDGKLTTSMKSLYGSNNVCHYGKFGYAIIAADAAYNMYRALNNNDMAIVITDTSGYAKREKIVLNGNTINLDISSMTDNITFRATCGSTAGTLGFVIKSNNADITNNIGVIVESGEKYYSINVQTLRYYENVTIDILYKTTQGKVCKVICRLTGYDVEVQEDYVWQFDDDLKARNTDGEVVNSFLENALAGSYTIEDGYLKANKLQLELENNILLSYDKNWSIEWKYGLLNDGFAGFLLCEDKANTIGNKALYHNHKGYFAVSDYYNSDGYRNYTTNDFTIKDNDCIRLTNQYDEATGKSVLSLWLNDELKVVNMQLKGCINGYIDNVDMTQYPLIANFEFEYLGNTGMTNWLVNCELDYLKISFEN